MRNRHQKRRESEPASTTASRTAERGAGNVVTRRRVGFPADCRAARGGACGGGRRRRKVGFDDRKPLSTVMGRVFQEKPDKDLFQRGAVMIVENPNEGEGWNDTQPYKTLNTDGWNETQPQNALLE